MAFDHRLAAPVRTTALGIWRNYDDGGAVRVQPILQRPRPLHSHTRPHAAVRVSLDTEFATLLPALNSYFPRVETMTGQQLRTMIRERAVPPPRLAPVPCGCDRTVPSSAGDIAVRIYWPESHIRSRARRRLRAWRRVRVLRSGLPRRTVPRYDERYRRGRGVCRLPAGAESPWPAAAEDVYAVAALGDAAGGSAAPIPASCWLPVTAPVATWPRWPP